MKDPPKQQQQQQPSKEDENGEASIPDWNEASRAAQQQQEQQQKQEEEEYNDDQEKKGSANTSREIIDHATNGPVQVHRRPRKVQSEMVVASSARKLQQPRVERSERSSTGRVRFRHGAPTRRKNPPPPYSQIDEGDDENENNLQQTNNTNNEDDNDLDPVDLLQIAAQRSRGIYRNPDGVPNETNRSNKEEEENLLRDMSRSAGLLRESSLAEDKLRHFNLDPKTTGSSSLSVPVSSDEKENAKDAASMSEDDAQLKGISSSANISNNTTTATNNNNNQSVRPGAYKGAPGRGFHRVSLTHPNEEDFSSMRGSVNFLGTDHNSTDNSNTNNNNDNTDDGDGPPAEEAAPHPPPLLDYTTSGNVIAAVRVDEDDLELQIRDEIHNTAAQAEIVDMEKETNDIVKAKLEKERKVYLSKMIALGAVLFVGVIVGVVLGVRHLRRDVDGADNGMSNEEVDYFATLRTIRERGYLNCGVAKRENMVFYHHVYYKAGVGFVTDFCKAIAAASLGGDANTSFVVLNHDEQWRALKNGTVDVMITGSPAVTVSKHWGLDPEIDVSFSNPFFYDGVGVGGIPEMVENCVDKGNLQNFLRCRSLKVCVVLGSAADEVAQQRLHPTQIVGANDLSDVYKRFGAGCCNVIGTDFQSDRAEAMVRFKGNYTGPYSIGAGLFTKQPIVAATRKTRSVYISERDNITALADQNPDVWSEFVFWVIESLIAAEEKNITQSTATSFLQTDVFGSEYEDMFTHAIAAVGNYGEIWNRTLEDVIPRRGMNRLHTGSSGLHFSRSIGDVSAHGNPPDENGTLSTILARGKLLCGVPVPVRRHILPAFVFGRRELSNTTSVPWSNTTTNTLSSIQQNVTEVTEEFLAEEYGVTFSNGSVTLSNATTKTPVIDVELCRALTAGIFRGQFELYGRQDSCSIQNSTNQTFNANTITGLQPTLEIVLLTDLADGYAKLQNGEVDVIAGHRLDLESDVNEPTTGRGFTFSQPYFFGSPSENGQITENNRCLVTRHDDKMWSKFVHIVAMSLFYAEENEITQEKANQMPLVNLFGSSFKRLMRDAVFATGHFGEVYERSAEQDLPRSGSLNELNSLADPQIVSMPFQGQSSNYSKNYTETAT